MYKIGLYEREITPLFGNSIKGYFNLSSFGYALPKFGGVFFIQKITFSIKQQ